MSDDPSSRGVVDATRVNVNESHEVAYWTGRWAVTESQLRDAVRKCGVMVEDVRRALGK